MKTVTIFGNQQIAIDILSYLRRRKEISLKAVVGCETVQDLSFGYPSLEEYCKNNNILYFDSESVFTKFSYYYPKIRADLYLSIYFRKIFTKKHLSKLGDVINIHPSLLPLYRGPSPTLWALLNNEQYIGTTIHHIDSAIDTGDIIVQKKFKIPDNITGFELNNLSMTYGTRLFKKVFPMIVKKNYQRTSQGSSETSYYGRFHASLRKIDWYQNSYTIHNKIRALTSPYAGAIAYFRGKRMLIWKSKISEGTSSYFGPGKIIAVTRSGFVVTTVDVPLIVSSYVFENPKEKVAIKKGDRFDLAM